MNNTALDDDVTTAAIVGSDSAADTPVDYRAALARVQADFTNYRRRTATDVTKAVDAATAELARELLVVLDALDLSENLAESHDEGLGEMTPVARLLRDTLTRAGLARIDTADVPYDPRIHEALESDSGHENVTSVLRAGYYWRDVLIRPALVQVGP